MNNTINHDNEDYVKPRECVDFVGPGKLCECVHFVEPGKLRQCVEIRKESQSPKYESSMAEPQESVQRKENKRRSVSVNQNDDQIVSVVMANDLMMVMTDESMQCPVQFYKELRGLDPKTQKEVLQKIKEGKAEIFLEDQKKAIVSHGRKLMQPRPIAEAAPCIAGLPNKGFVEIARGFAVQRECTYYVADPENPMLLFRGHISCDHIRYKINRDGKIVCEERHIAVCTNSNKKEFWIKADEISRAVIKRMRSVPGVTIEKGAEHYIQNLVSLLAENAKRTNVYIEAGWQEIEGRYYFLHDGRRGGFDIESEKHICYQEGVDCCRIFRQMMGVFNDRRLAGPMLLYSLFGIMYFLFVKAGYRPTTILFIAGETGCLKTSSAKVLYRLWNTDQDEEVFSFQSTTASIEPMIRDTYDSIFLMDDYCVNAVSEPSMKRAMEKNMHTFVRYYGDGNSKKKSNIAGDLIRAPRPRGGAVITGEICADGVSSLLRTLTIQIPKDGINGEALAVFQEQHALWPTFLGYFINFVESNFERTVEEIRASYTNMRKKAEPYFTARRSVDRYVELILIDSVLYQFLIAQGMGREEADMIFQSLQQGAAEQILASERIAQQENPKRVLIEAMVDAIDTSLRMVTSKEIFQGMQGCDGYIENGIACILKKNFVDAVNKVLAVDNQSVEKLGFSWQTIPKNLFDEYGIFRSFKNGRSNLCYTTYVKGSGKGREKAFVINVDRLRETKEQLI